MHKIFSIKLLLVTLALAGALKASAQSEPLLANYFEIPAFYNPAAIGISDNIRINGDARLQWLGIENAPQTFMGTANMPFKLGGKKLAVGAMVKHDKAGLYTNLNAAAQVGYKFKAFKGEFTIGAQVGLFDQGFKGSKVVVPDNDDYHQSTDEAIPTMDVHGSALDVGAGIFFQHPKFWAGISCQHATSPTVKMQGEGMTGGVGGSTVDGNTEGSNIKNYEFQQPRTLYFMAGSNIPIKNTLFEVMPSIMVASDFTFTTGQATLRARYNKFLSAGVGYRYNDAVMALLGVEFKGIFIGYSYEYPTTAIAKASSGSHEIVLGYSMKLDFSDKNRHRHKNIRIM